jgi:hypothetical protein
MRQWQWAECAVLVSTSHVHSSIDVVVALDVHPISTASLSLSQSLSLALSISISIAHSSSIPILGASLSSGLNLRGAAAFRRRWKPRIMAIPARLIKSTAAPPTRPRINNANVSFSVVADGRMPLEWNRQFSPVPHVVVSVTLTYWMYRSSYA